MVKKGTKKRKVNHDQEAGTTEIQNVDICQDSEVRRSTRISSFKKNDDKNSDTGNFTTEKTITRKKASNKKQPEEDDFFDENSSYSGSDCSKDQSGRKSIRSNFKKKNTSKKTKKKQNASKKDSDEIDESLLKATKSSRVKNKSSLTKSEERAKLLIELSAEEKRRTELRNKFQDLQNKLNACKVDYETNENIQEHQFVPQSMVDYMLDDKEIFPGKISNFVQTLVPSHMKLNLHGLSCYHCTYFGNQVCEKEVCEGPLKVTEDMKKLVEDIFGFVDKESIDKNFKEELCKSYTETVNKKQSGKGKKSSNKVSNQKTNHQRKKHVKPHLVFHYKDEHFGDDFDSVKMKDYTFEKFLEEKGIFKEYGLKSEDVKSISWKYDEGKDEKKIISQLLF